MRFVRNDNNPHAHRRQIIRIGHSSLHVRAFRIDCYFELRVGPTNNVESVLQTVRRAGAHRFHEAILRLACNTETIRAFEHFVERETALRCHSRLAAESVRGVRSVKNDHERIAFHARRAFPDDPPGNCDRRCDRDDNSL